MPRMFRVYSGSDGKSHLAEVPLDMKPFSDVEGAHGEGTPAQNARTISFRVSPPGYELSWHCAPRRQYSISLSGQVEIEVGDGTKARVGPGDIVPRGDREEGAGVVVKADRIVEACRLGGHVAEAAHAFGAVVEPPGGAQFEAGIMPGEGRQLTRIDAFVEGEEDDREARFIAVAV